MVFVVNEQTRVVKLSIHVTSELVAGKTAGATTLERFLEQKKSEFYHLT